MPPGGVKPDNAGNYRNGASGKTVLTDGGPLRIEVPRDRDATVEPLLIPKHERRITGYDPITLLGGNIPSSSKVSGRCASVCA